MKIVSIGWMRHRRNKDFQGSKGMAFAYFLPSHLGASANTA